MSVTRVRDHDVHYMLLGDGPHTVVFVHGMVMDNLASWYFTSANAVSQHQRVLLYDLRGHGRSEFTEDGYTIPELIDDLDALLDELGIEGPVVIVGNSFGGLVALAYTMARPERVEGLVMVDGNMHDDGWQEDIRRRFGAAAEDREAARKEIFTYGYKYAGQDSPRKRNQLGRRAARLVNRSTFTDDIAEFPPYEPSDLAAIACPVLAIYGEYSELADRARRMAAAIPRCELVLVKARTHLLLWEEPTEVRDRIIAWLETF